MRCAGEAHTRYSLPFLGGCTTTDSLSTNYSIERNQPAPGHWIQQPRLLSELREIVFDQQESRELFQTTEQTLLEPGRFLNAVGWVLIRWRGSSVRVCA